MKYVVLIALISCSMAWCQPTAFDDPFSTATLDPAWTLVPGVNSFSLTANPGYLRHALGQSTNSQPPATLARQFSGTNWTLDYRAIYYLPPNLGENLSFRVYFDSSTAGTTFLDWLRRRDDGYGQNYQSITFYDNGATIPPTTAPLCPDDTCYLRVERLGQTVTVSISADGVAYTRVAAQTYAAPLGNVQTIELVGTSFVYSTAYADYDYIRVAPSCTPPTITALAASPSTLWPPNHKMVPVAITATTSNGCGGVTCRIASVASNEPPGPDGDWVVTGALSVNLRAERAGLGFGRVYTVTVQCSDTAGNTVTRTVTVTVPHDQGH